MAQYNYNKEINSDKLLLEIKETLSLLLDGSDGRIETRGSQVKIITNEELTSEQKTILDSIIVNHISDYPEGDFDIQLFLNGFATKFNPLERLELSKEAPSFITELQYKNFAEIKMIRDYLYSQQKITAEQVTKFNNLFLEQRINLDNY